MEQLPFGVLAALIGLAGGTVLGLAARLGDFCTLRAVETSVYGADQRRRSAFAGRGGVMGILGFIALSGPLAPLRILLFPQVETTGLHGIDIAVSGLTGAPPLLIALAWSGAVISLRQLIGGFQPNKAISEKVVRLFRFEIATNQ